MKTYFVVLAILFALAIPASADKPDVKIGVVTSNHPITTGSIVCVEKIGAPAKLAGILNGNIEITSWTWYIQRDQNISSRKTIGQGGNMSVIELDGIEEATYLLEVMIGGKPYMAYVTILEQGTVLPENSFEMFIRQEDGVIWRSEIFKSYEAAPIEFKPRLDREIPENHVLEWAWYRDGEKLRQGSGNAIEPLNIKDNAEYQLLVCFRS